MSERNAALAGMIGPVMFVVIVIVLTVAQYGFMRELGWIPREAPACPGRASWL